MKTDEEVIYVKYIFKFNNNSQKKKIMTKKKTKSSKMR